MENKAIITFIKTIFRAFIFSYAWVLLGYSIVTGYGLAELISRKQISSGHNYLVILAITILTIALKVAYSRKNKLNNEDLNKESKLLLIAEVLVLASIVLPFLNLSLISFSWLPLQTIFIKYAIYWQIAAFSLATTLLVRLISKLFFNKQLTYFINFINKNSSLIVYILIFVAVLVRFLLTLYQHDNFQTPTWDLGIYDQTIWNISLFRGFDNSIVGNHLAYHFSPIIILLVPFYWIFDSVKVLFLFEPLIYSLGALPIFWFSKEYLKNNIIAIALAFIYLFFIGSQYGLGYPFHPSTFAAPLMAFIFYFLWKKNYFWHFIFVILLLAVKENTGLYLVFIGVFSLLFNCNKKIILIDIFIGIAWFVIVTKLIIPSFSGGEYGYFAFKNFGKSYFDVFLNMIFHPLHTISVFFNPVIKVDTFLKNMLSVGFLPLFYPIAVIASLPMFIEQALTSRSTQWSIVFHYSLALSTPLVLASALSIQMLIKKLKWPIYNIVALFLVMVVIIESGVIHSPLSKIVKKSTWQINRESRIASSIIQNVPDSASIMSTGAIGPHLMHRRVSKSLSTNPDTEYVVISKVHGHWPFSREELDDIIANLQNNPEYRLLKSGDDGNILLFKQYK